MNKTNLGEEEKHHFDEFLIHFEETTKGATTGGVAI